MVQVVTWMLCVFYHHKNLKKKFSLTPDSVHIRVFPGHALTQQAALSYSLLAEKYTAIPKTANLTAKELLVGDLFGYLEALAGANGLPYR